MKRILFFFLALVLILSSFGMAFAGETNVLSSYSKISEDEIFEKLENLSTLDIIEEMNIISQNVKEYDALMYHAMSLYDRLPLIDDGFLISNVNNEENELNTRIVLLQLIAGKDKDKDSKKLYNDLLLSIIKDANSEDIIKRNAIVQLEDNATDVKILSDIAVKEDGLLAFQALKKLNKIKPTKAQEIAYDILSDKKNNDNEKTCAAVKVIAEKIETSKYLDSDEANDFVDLCERILKDCKDSTMRDTVGFALSDIGTIHAVKLVLNSEELPDYIKKDCMDQNKEILLNLDIPIQNSLASTRVTGYQGYAVYRDGVALIEWHAGLMYKSTSSKTSCVVEAPGGSNVTRYASWQNFLAGNNFKGVYKPEGGISSSARDNIVETAARIAAERIEYTLYQQIIYDSQVPQNTKAEPSDINYIRCDGVVEYAFEYNGYPIFGGNIAIKNTDTLMEHSQAHITPKSQAQKYMSLVTTNTP